MRVLQEHLLEAAPRWWGRDEPLRERWGADSQAEVSRYRDFMFDSGPRGSADGSVLQAEAGGGYGTIHLAIEPNLLGAGAVAVAQQWSERFAADYAHVHLITGDQVRPKIPHGVQWDGGEAPFLYIISEHELHRFLPDFWGTVLGPAYVRLLGAEHIARTPAFEVTPLTPEMFWIQLTRDVHDVENDYPAYVQVRERAKAHLGEDLFYSLRRGGKGQYRTIGTPTPEPQQSALLIWAPDPDATP